MLLRDLLATSREHSQLLVAAMLRAEAAVLVLWIAPATLSAVVSPVVVIGSTLELVHTDGGGNHLLPCEDDKHLVGECNCQWRLFGCVQLAIGITQSSSSDSLY